MKITPLFPDGSNFDSYVPGRIISDGFSTEHNAYTYSYNMHEVTVTASRYTWAEQWCRDYTWNRRGQYSPEYSGGEVYISPTTSFGGGGSGGGNGGSAMVPIQMATTTVDGVVVNNVNYYKKYPTAEYVVGGAATMIGGAAKQTNIAFNVVNEVKPLSPITKIANAGTVVGIAGLAYNVGYNLYLSDAGMMSKTEAWTRIGVSVVEFGLTFVPYVGPILSIALIAYDLGGGFDDNLYSIGKP